MPKLVFERSDAVPKLAECFRIYGFEGASIKRITEHTGLGKGSLYNFFPGGKDEMAEAVLIEISDWFERNIYQVLEQGDGLDSIEIMFMRVATYFQSGNRICLVGAFALDQTRRKFVDQVVHYFSRWIDCLSSRIVRLGGAQEESRALAVQIVGGIQGAVVLSRAMDDDELFVISMNALSARIQNFINCIGE